LNVIVTSSVLAVHGALLIVQRNVYVVPAVPLNELVGLPLAPKLPPVPEMMLQAPVPTVAVLPAKVVLVTPQRLN
jgi:hypothetical protein